MSDFPEDQLLVAVFPGVPTAAELFLLPHNNQSQGKKKSEEGLEQVYGIYGNMVNLTLEMKSLFACQTPSFVCV